MSLLQIFCLKLLKHRNQGYVQFYIDFPLYHLENLNTFSSNGNFQNTFYGNFGNIGIFSYQSSSSVNIGNKVHIKYSAPSGYEILTASVFWKDNIQENDYIGFDYERTNTEITVVYSTAKSSRSYSLTLFCKKLN